VALVQGRYVVSTVDDYAFCPDDRFWFRPLYTDGKCPLCGEVAPGGGAVALPLHHRADRFLIGMAGVALVSVATSAFVLYAYLAA
jgi:hypothetical protein